MKHEYKIYQLDANNENVRRDGKLFKDWDMLNRTCGFCFNWEYKLVWEGEIEVYDDTASEEKVLDKLFEQFNVAHPKNYHGRSMSVSDVVVLNGTMYYCDSFGWQKI